MGSALLGSAMWQKPTLGNVAMVYIYTLPHCQRGYGFEKTQFKYLNINVLNLQVFSKTPFPNARPLAII